VNRKVVFGVAQVARWLRKKPPQMTWKQLQRRYFGKDRVQADGITLYNPADGGSRLRGL
jgi:hypothetical protein